MNRQQITKPIPKVALIGLYNPIEEEEPVIFPVHSQGTERQEVTGRLPHLVAQPMVLLELARPYRTRVR